MPPCCTWETFEGGFLAIWDRAGASSRRRQLALESGKRKAPPDPPGPPRLLIDWRLAERHWRRYAMTGGEAAKMQLQALSTESLYLHMRGDRPGPDAGGGGDDPNEPTHTGPAPRPTTALC